MKFSIITAVLNGKATIEQAIRSLSSQTYKNFEHIIVDGGSTDGTLEFIETYDNHVVKILSGNDHGIYDALNKGLGLSSGDVMGILNADDFYASDTVLETVMNTFMNHKVDSCYGDLQYVDKKDIHKVIRHWKSSQYSDGKFKYGWMPPHPTFFVKKVIYDRFGYFNTNFHIAADYELMLRFLVKHRISTRYIPHVLIRMRWGGVSNRNLRNMILKSYEDYLAWKANGLKRGFYTIPMKNISKIPQFLSGRH